MLVRHNYGVLDEGPLQRLIVAAIEVCEGMRFCKIVNLAEPAHHHVLV